MSNEINEAIVIDNGSSVIKSGFAGNAEPSSLLKPSDLLIPNPFQNGLINNWDNMEKVWSHIFANELEATPKDRAIFLTEPLFNSLANREKIVEVMFDSFGVSSMYLSSQAVLALYAHGRVTGVVLESGESRSNVVPMFEGYVMKDGILTFSITGHELTKSLRNVFNERKDLDCLKKLDLKIVQSLKEKIFYVADDFEKELKKHKPISYELPDGTLVQIGSEAFECPEALFDPELLDINNPGIHQTLFNSIKRCDMDIRRDLYQNIVMTGGNTMIRGLSDRLGTEMNKLVPKSVSVNIHEDSNRNISTWVGGSIIASLTNYKDMWIKRDEYNEFGPNIVHSKFKQL